MGKRIVLLVNPGNECRSLAHCMVQAGCAPSLIVREETVERYPYSWPSRIARRLLGDKFVDRVGQARLPEDIRRLLAWEGEMRDASQTWLDEASAALVPGTGWPEGISTLDTRDVNAPDIVHRVAAERPDLVVVYGTGLLRAPLLALPVKGTLNAHSSMLPHYRGARSEFWQCYNDDPSAVGITVHLVDPSVDTGSILFQCSTRSTWPSDPYRLRAVNVLATLENYPRVINEYLGGLLSPAIQGPTSTPTYRKRDTTLEARLALKKRIAG
ncbi:MAG: hypothetical protein IPL52_02510 [Flavobacteriales bacterium]|nr:hypothetical protein [Flavobacteriales bacterium]